jgi:hypothetical protein
MRFRVIAMTSRVTLLGVSVVAWLSIAGATAAQTTAPEATPSSRSRITASELMQGRDVAPSFDALSEFLAPGYEVVVTDTAGSSRRGRVVSLTQDHIVLASPVSAGQWEALPPLLLVPFPFLWPVDLVVHLRHHKDRAFAEGSVNEIDIVDPAWNGTAIGGAVGVGAAASVYLIERQQPASNLKGIWTFMAIVVGIPVSLRVGHVLDRAINEPVYQRRPRAQTVTVAPQVAPHAVGVAVHVQY